MMGNNSESKNPVGYLVAVIGYASTIIASVSPLLVNTPILDYFLDKTLIKPVSFITFIVSLIVSWLGYRYMKYGITIQLFALPHSSFLRTHSGRRLNINIRQQLLSEILVVLAFFSAFRFLYLLAQGNMEYSFEQSLWYSVFFISLSWAISVLVGEQINQFMFNSQRESQHLTIQSAIINAGILGKNISINERRQATPNDLQRLGISNPGYDLQFSSIVKVKIASQQEATYELLMSSDYKTIIKVSEDSNHT